MQIRARGRSSIDRIVTTPEGWPALTTDPAFVSGPNHVITEFLECCEVGVAGRTTFEPALEPAAGTGVTSVVRPAVSQGGVR